MWGKTQLRWIPIVLGDDNISRLHPVDQGKVHAVSSLVKDQCLGTLPLDAVRCVTEDFHWHAVGPANSHRQVNHRATICINQNRWHCIPLQPPLMGSVFLLL